MNIQLNIERFGLKYSAKPNTDGLEPLWITFKFENLHWRVCGTYDFKIAEARREFGALCQQCYLSKHPVRITTFGPAREREVSCS